MAYIDKQVYDTDVVVTMVDNMVKNGWKLVHRFTKVVVPTESIKNSVVTIKSTDLNIEWEIPKGINPDNVRLYGKFNVEQVESLAENLEYTINRKTRVITIPNKGGVDQEATIYVYHPSTSIGFSGSGYTVGSSTQERFLKLNLAVHYILENNQLTKDENKKKSLFGIAKYSEVVVPYSYLSNLKPFLAPSEEDPLKFTIIDYGSTIEQAINLAFANPGFYRPSIYTYMLDEYNNPDKDIQDPLVNHPKHATYMLTMDGDPKRLALDCEVFKSKWETDDITVKPKSAVVKSYPEHNQSPIIESDYRHPQIAQVLYHTDYKVLVNSGNVWRDSKVRLRASIDEGTAIFMVLAGTTPSFEKNAIPLIPIYIGEGEDLKNYKREAGDESVLDIIFGGTVPKVNKIDDVPEFDFDLVDRTKFYKNILPILRNDAESYGNGLDNVIVRKEKDGTRDALHYISTAVPPNFMPPDRVHDSNGLKYPRAWQQATNTEYSYKFNPSRSTDKVTTGEALLMHPENGMRGKIRNIILMNPLSLVTGDTIRIVNDYCADPTSDDAFFNYTYFMVEGICPFTKKPSVHYRPMGVALLQTGDTVYPDGVEPPDTVEENLTLEETIAGITSDYPEIVDTYAGGAWGTTPGTPGVGELSNWPKSIAEKVVFSADDIILTEKALEKMTPGSLWLMVCNETTAAGCRYNAYYNGYKIAENVDIEAGHKHKAIKLDTSKLINGGGTIKIEALANKQEKWNVYVFTYDQAMQFINNSSVPLKDVALAHDEIMFEDLISEPSDIVGSLGSVFTFGF